MPNAAPGLVMFITAAFVAGTVVSPVAVRVYDAAKEQYLIF